MTWSKLQKILGRPGEHEIWNHPGFKPGDSCINQGLAITHEIYKPFDGFLDVRAVFLDISKAFDKV